jgi:AcrR family transcriptional regulator
MLPVASAPPQPKSADTASTRDRLIDAAARVCAERGLHGATTREIADAAGVNEVTLFRHFGNKEKLLAAMFAQLGAAQSEALSGPESDEEDLAHDLLHYAERLNEMLFSNEALIRTMIGEAQRQPETARQVIYEASRPLRQRLIAYLERGQRAGLVRRDLDLSPTVDAFTGMMLSGMLRRTSVGTNLEYAQDDYVKAAVDLFIRGVQAPARRRPPTDVRKRARS